MINGAIVEHAEKILINIDIRGIDSLFEGEQREEKKIGALSFLYRASLKG